MRRSRQDPVRRVTWPNSKGTFMKMKFLLLISCCCAIVLSAYRRPGPRTLSTWLPGPGGNSASTCHEGFKATMNKSFIHTPLAEGDCTGCHNRMPPNHGKLLSEDESRICFSCHDGLVPVAAESSHQSVEEGKCIACHDPHSADNEMNLLRPGSELCFSCHEDLGRRIGQNKVPHSPVGDDCLTCHNPHASADNPSLLKVRAPELCLQCHDASKKTFKVQHVDYPVERADCSVCHNPARIEYESDALR